MGIWTARQIWKGLDRDLRNQVALSLWSDERVTRQDRMMALTPWMTARGLRPNYLEKLPKTRRAALLAEGGLPEETATQLLMSYHLVHQRPMLGRFLGELGIPHEDGVIEDGAEFDQPTDEAVAKAVEVLRAEFPADAVGLYLRALTATDPDTWEPVGKLIEDPA